MSDAHHPRYSIIPGAACTDPNLEGHDLQVLCFLGRHTNNLGWCFLAQGTIAAEIGCSRSTVQRSLARLRVAGYVQFKSAPATGRPHACHAYRVVMDRDDPAIGPSESEIASQAADSLTADEGCAPMHTPPAEVCTGAQGCPPRVHTGAQPYVGTERPSPEADDDGGSARARGFVYSPEAHKLSADIAKLCGHDIEFLPLKWAREGARTAQAYLDAGYAPEMMFEEVKLIVSRKRDGAPQSLGYFRHPFERAHALRAQPELLPPATDRPQQHRRQAATGGIAAALIGKLREV